MAMTERYCSTWYIWCPTETNPYVFSQRRKRSRSIQDERHLLPTSSPLLYFPYSPLRRRNLRALRQHPTPRSSQALSVGPTQLRAPCHLYGRSSKRPSHQTAPQPFSQNTLKRRFRTRTQPNRQLVTTRRTRYQKAKTHRSSPRPTPLHT